MCYYAVVFVCSESLDACLLFDSELMFIGIWYLVTCCCFGLYVYIWCVYFVVLNIRGICMPVIWLLLCGFCLGFDFDLSV